ncbi:MAG: serine/threonine-protein kinase, partial [Elusimicrobiota bacterium]
EETKQIKDRFFREAESAGTLNHPGIVKIYDAGEEQDICFIAMELLDGHDLTKFGTKEGMLDPLTAMDYVARVAEALDFAHGQGIVHRDIKPANIMLLKDGTIRVADFGIARITASSKTATGTVMGTPSYMSPEQIAGRKVDGRSDLFSLGVALFELLTGEKPFKGGEGIGTLLFQIANDPEPEPLAVNPKMPRCASAVVHKALKKQPDERYQKGSEMAADLKACIELVKSGKDTAAAQEPPSSKGVLSPLPQRAAVPAAPEPVAAPVAAEAVQPEPEPVAAAPEAAETVVLPPAAEEPPSSEGGLSPLPQGAAAESPTAWMADAAPTLSAAAAAEEPPSSEGGLSPFPQGAAAEEPPSEAPAPTPVPVEQTM